MNYTVKRGDTLGKLAARFNTTVKAIATANSIKNVNLIRVGQRLIIGGSNLPTQASFADNNTPLQTTGDQYTYNANGQITVPNAFQVAAAQSAAGLKRLQNQNQAQDGSVENNDIMSYNADDNAQTSGFDIKTIALIGGGLVLVYLFVNSK